jgi:DNA-binding MarR family transcriptional regulator
MHAILFGLKRAYWGSIARSRRPLHEHQPHLTAARFDLMHAIRKRDSPAPMLQSELRRALGVCRPVVTRMLESLVRLGWIVRKRSLSDQRTYDVRLTEEGEKVIDWAYYRFVISVRAKRWVNQALLGMETWPDKDRAFTATATLDEQLARMRAVWNARGTLYYPWHPDD